MNDIRKQSEFDKKQAQLLCDITVKLIAVKASIKDKAIRNSISDIVLMISLFCDTAPLNLINNDVDTVMEHMISSNFTDD